MLVNTRFENTIALVHYGVGKAVTLVKHGFEKTVMLVHHGAAKTGVHREEAQAWKRLGNSLEAA